MSGLIQAISLWQPWATAYCMPEVKDFETRHWKTNYRGPLLIHATASLNVVAKESWKSNVKGIWQQIFPDLNVLPLGSIVGMVNLKECYNSDDAKKFLDTDYRHKIYPKNHLGRFEIELAFGDWRQGRFFWYAPEKLLFDEPIEYKGQQGLWNFQSRLLPGQAKEFIKNC